jgi:hypothetical protein
MLVIIVDIDFNCFSLKDEEGNLDEQLSLIREAIKESKFDKGNIENVIVIVEDKNPCFVNRATWRSLL